MIGNNLYEQEYRIADDLAIASTVIVREPGNSLDFLSEETSKDSSMKAALALTIILPFLSTEKAVDPWLTFTSNPSRLKFEMPKAPMEREMKSGADTEVRTFVCEKDEIVFEAIAMELSPDLKMALGEATSDAEESVSRQVINGILEESLQELEPYSSRNEYTRIQKLPCRITLAKISPGREAKLLSVIAKNHAYLFIVSYPIKPESKGPVNRFFESIRFQS